MASKRSWTDADLITAVNHARSIRAVLIQLHLVPAGGNYQQVKKRINDLGLSIEHFTGSRWNKGTFYSISTREGTYNLLVTNSSFQSHKLKQKLYNIGVKEPVCELCGWSERAEDGRIPVELDHINGVHSDNRLSNLRILCPNCHSLQPTHRGKNKRQTSARML